MKKSNISFASSISFDKNYDPIDTLSFCKKNSVNRAQLYMDSALMDNAKRISVISNEAKKSNISLICHSPTPLNRSIIDEKIIKSIQKLLKHQSQKKIVVHFDPDASISEIMTTIENLNSTGLTVCLENFYPHLSREKVLQNIASYNIILTLSAEHEFDVIPVIDLPRLFVDSIIDHSDSQLLTEFILQTISSVSEKLILHIIDFNNANQSRKTWVAIGKGIMPYRQIFKKIKSLNIEIDEVVLEYEDKKLALDSVKQLYNF